MVKTVSANTDAVCVWTAAEFKSAFGKDVSNSSVGSFVGFMNGDGKANSQHFGAATYLNGNIYMVTNGMVAANTATRINYLVMIA